jgi:hypothetical protein
VVEQQVGTLQMRVRFPSPGSRSFYGGCGLMVKASLCESENASSILVIHPNGLDERTG